MTGSTPSCFSSATASLLLSRWFGHVGIAAATSIAAWANAILLATELTRRGHYRLDDRLKARLPKILLCAVAMGLLLLLGLWFLEGNFTESASFSSAAWGLLVLIAGGGASYFALAHFSGAMSLAEMRAVTKR